MRLTRWLSCLLTAVPLSLTAQYQINYEGSLTAVGSSGDFAPYYINSLKHGRFSQGRTLLAEAKAWRPMETDKRFTYGFGVDVIADATSKVEYERYDVDTDTWHTRGERPSALWLQQLYGEIRYRGVFLQAGLKEHGSMLLNQRLSSGDLVESGNTRPMPEVRIGFADFQDIPLTNGWVQIQGEINYARMLDDNWLRDHYNYYNYRIVSDEWYSYKRMYFRSNPDKPFSATLGLQAASIFGGKISYYSKGKVWRSYDSGLSFKDFVHALIPTRDGREGFVSGSHLGSIDFKARYRLKGLGDVSAYFSWPWEDGTGLAKLNGWDGLWGIEYKAKEGDHLSGLVVEYLDFTNQSGPMHFEPNDYAGSTIPYHASGADDYYNNFHHRAYAYYGHSIGTPAIMAPIYNRDGYIGFLANRMRGVHVAAEGTVVPGIDYLVKGGYRKAWGSGKVILPRPIHSASFLFQASWRPAKAKGLKVAGAISWDNGTMPSKSFGGMVSVKYDGILNL